MTITIEHGKYRGERLSTSIIKEHPFYFYWLVNQSDFKGQYANTRFLKKVMKVLGDMKLKMPFGKHKGEFIDELPEDYAEYMRKKNIEGLVGFKLMTDFD